MESLKYSLPMSSANTFTEFEKALEQEIGQKRRGKKGSSTKIMMVRNIEVEWELWDAMEIDTDDEQAIQITTNSESAIVNISDKDCFFKRQLCVVQESAGYGGIWERIVRYVVNKPYIKNTMWIAVDSTGLNATYTIHIEINFSYKYINDWVLQRIISRRV
jgi:hypothetical protein